MIVDLLTAATSALAAILLVCMLQVEFRRSSMPFRWAVKALAASLLAAAFLPWIPGPGADVVNGAVHVALVAVLGLVRWRQLKTGRCGAR